jgi:pimeloyl-ACP methyl ester carboxylesterase/DNA-binding CsgD family transcriptional regulator
MSPRKQQIRICTSQDNVRIAYAISGSGPPLVKAANWMGHLGADLQSPIWGHLFSELTRNHTLVCYDERGWGLSDKDVEDLSLAARLHDLEAVIVACGIDRFPLLGISQGASLAVAYTVSHPEQVTHLILYGGFARGRLKRNLTPQLREEAEMMVKLAELGWAQENPAFRQFFTTQYIPNGTTEQQRWVNELVRNSTSPATAARYMCLVNEIDVVDLLPKISCPTLVMHAIHDGRVPFEEGLLIASRIPKAHFVPLESRNHFLLEDEPAWQRWVEEIRAFLQAPVARVDPAFAVLSPREREVVELIARGCDNAQIAAHLGLSEKTVRNHITSIFDKLEVENRSQTIVLAREAGFGSQSA